MGLILSGAAFTACENNANESYHSSKEIAVEKKSDNAYGQLYTFNVNARDWIKPSSVGRYVKVKITSITSEIIKKGRVIIYMDENDKMIALPFTYYQVRRAVSFQPFYEPEWIHINVLGSFILNNSISYSFKVLIINSKGVSRLRNRNTNNFKETKSILKF